MTTLLDLNADIRGANAYAPAFATDNYSATLMNGVEETVTCPTGNFKVYQVVFSIQPGCNVWVANGATAAIPVGATFASTTSTLNPGVRTIAAGAVLHLITDNVTADVGVSFYAIS